MSEQEAEHGREVRAARNQSRFRAVAKRLAALNETRAVATSVAMTYFLIACECADPTCIEMVTVRSDEYEYEAVRTQPRRFAVLPGHVYNDVEQVVGTGGRYVIVEKFGSGRWVERPKTPDATEIPPRSATGTGGEDRR